MIRNLAALLLLHVLCGLGSTQEPTYVVTFPKNIRAGFPVQFVAELLRNPNPVTITAYLSTPGKEIDIQTRTSLVAGESKLVTFSEQIPIGYDGTNDFELSIVGVDVVTNETVIRNSSDQLIYEHKSLSIFVQTDKGIYKPSQTIKFRAVVTDPNLLPYNGTVFYKLSDPDDNIILQKKNAVLVNGIVGTEFTLGRYSTLGIWKIVFECEGNSKVATVTVDEYELPKFEVDFSPNQKFLHGESQELSGKISAKFTFGEPVKGVASLRLQVTSYYYRSPWPFHENIHSLDRVFNDFDGEAEFNVPMDEIKKKLEWHADQYYPTQIKVIVKVTDKNSQIELNDTSYMDLVKNPLKTEKINAPSTAKPGFLYTAYLRITQHDGSRITEQQRQGIDMRIKYTYSYYSPSYLTVQGYLDVDVDDEGYIVVSTKVNNSRFDELSFTTDSAEQNLYWYVRRYDSPSNTYVQLWTEKTTLKPGDRGELDVLSSRSNGTYSVMMMSRGIIVRQESYSPATYETDEDVFKFRYEFTVTREMAPTVAIVFSFMAAEGEIVADNIVLNVDSTMVNTVSLSPNVNRTETGAPIVITVQTTPGSSIALRAIDRSVILQKKGNDITNEKVLEDIKQYGISAPQSCAFCYYWRPDGSNAKQILKESGFLVFTDAATFLSQELIGSHKATLLFRNTGEKTYSLTLPDTTTTWEISAFVVSHSAGLGVLDPDVQAVLKLEESEWYEILMNGNDTSVEGPVRDITIPSNDGKTEIFTIRFLRPGTAVIKLTAISELATDAIERTLPVKAAGIQRDVSQSAVVEKNYNDTAIVTTFDIEIPPVIVEGSIYGKLSVSGSVMGNSWNNLGNLLKLPTGCGEQTMLSFAPDVFISLYLQKVGLLEGEIELKSTRHITAGYQNELRYQRDDGSFSAFGMSDSKGSTWLTAFVVKSFIAARTLNSDFAHEEKIDPAVEFLLSTQQEDGSFLESGPVRHKDMQGGVSSAETMTAYVLIALAEGRYKSGEENVANAIGSARRYLESKALAMTEVYATSVIAYALALSGSSVVDEVVTRLEDTAKIAGDMRYWAGESTVCQDGSESGYCWDADASASDIEMTSYALLAFIKVGKQDQAMPIVRWIIKQRSSLGGYRSTQDTVMAIQALSVFAGLYSNRPGDLTVNVMHSADASFNANMSVTMENAIVLQSVELPPHAGVVTVNSFGEGLADVQVSYRYNLPRADPANEPFVVDPEITAVDGFDKVKMKICSRINKEAKKPITKTGMFVVAVTLPSGYSVDDKDATDQNKNAKMVELAGDEITGYFDELPENEDLCFEFYMERFMKVGEIQPQMIRVLDYYEPELTSLRMYAPPGSENLCATFGSDFHGCPDGGATAVAASIITMSILTTFVTYLCH